MRKFKALGALCLLFLLTFSAAKAVFIMANGGSLADWPAVALHGLTLDLSTALYFLVVPYLLMVASDWLRIPPAVLKTYLAVVAAAFALAFTADTSLYPFWHFKLDASCLQYLATPSEAMASVSTAYLLLRIAAVAAVTVVLYLLYRQTVDGLLSPPPPAFSLSALFVPLRILAMILLLPLMIVGIRGGLSESTTNIGQAYFSQNQFLNHAAVNPVFSFLSSLGKSGDYIVSYDFYDERECQAITDGVYDSQTLPADTLLRTPRPNIVIILMESCGGQFTEMAGRKDIMPNVNRLMHEGVNFAQCYASSWRTDRGMVSTLSGYPAFPTSSVMKVPEKSRNLPSLAKSLSREGYECSFFYGGDINFTNMRSYVLSSGYGRLMWRDDYSRDQRRSAQWGVRDDIMFASLLADIEREQKKGTQHWMKTLLTLSSHEPWDVPDKVMDDKTENAFHYADACLGDFLARLRQTTAWDSLLVVVLPDHGLRNDQFNETTRAYNHIPLIWTGGAVRTATTVDKICSQSDLAATLLGQMGMRHDDFVFSRDVLSDDYRRQLAFHTFVNGLTVYDSTGFMAYDLDANTFIAHEGSDTLRLLSLGKALLQLHTKHLKSL